MLKQITLSRFCIILIITASLNKVHAQTSADSLSNKVTAYNNTIDKFYVAIGTQSRLFNGKEYEGNYPGVEGSAYFLAATDWGTGDIVYDGYTYKDVKIRYDLYKDEVVIPLYQSFLKISLLSDRVKSFGLLGHFFVYIKSDSKTIDPVKDGFYDQLYGGKIQVLCKRDESIQQDHTTSGITTYFSSTTDYYIFKNNQYFTVNSKGEFLDVLKDKKREIRQFISTNKIKFKKDTKDQDMARVAEYYDHLSN